eukprot:ANDGO_01933.mRNA.1 Brefeldin A-inhibited guanine nucleotide-exchange protein 3
MSSASLHIKSLLERLLKDVSSKKFAKIKESCLESLKDLENLFEHSSNVTLPRGQGLGDRFFIPFMLACESKVPKVVEIALDCILSMMTNGNLIGNYIVKKSTLSQTSAPVAAQVHIAAVNGTGADESIFADVVIKTVCSCFDVHSEIVELLIVKILLSAVATCMFHVHGSSLLFAVRTCYNIHLVSKNMVNQVTAKAAIAQMLSIVCQRFEISKVDAMQLSKGEEFVEERQTRERVQSMSPELREDEEIKTFVVNVFSRIVAAEEFANSAKLMLASNANINSNAPTPGTPKSPASTASPLPVVVSASTSSSPTPSMNGGIGLSTATNSPVSAAASAAPSLPQQMPEPEDPSSSIFASIHEKDIFLLFRALCKLSMKAVPEDAPPDSVDMRSRVLALEYLLLILDHAGPSLKANDRFILAIKQFLCISILKNCITVVPVLFRLAATIFLLLMSNFAEYLKIEIAVFFNNIFFRVLEASHSSFHQRMIVLQVMLKICLNPQMLVDMYVNYDCELTESNVFERFVEILSVVFQTPMISDPQNPQPPIYESSLRVLALEALTALVRSMSLWMDARRQSDALGSLESTEDVSIDEEEEVNNVSRSSSANISLITDPFERQRQLKIEILEGVKRFNEKPKKGIVYLAEAGCIKPDDAESLAYFLRTTPGLDKTKVGEYLGEGDDFNVRVLYHYVDALAFQGMLFDDALRHFLSGFRLPGEAQKIDRMMEKFAERFCKDNPGVFASADTAYVLAYSTIMLQTDAHNPMVKRKMTREGFIANNRGINDGKDLPSDFLGELYERIVQKAITLEEDKKLEIELADKKNRQRLLREETERIFEQSHVILSKGIASNKQFYSSSKVEHIRSMMELCKRSLIKPFSTVLDNETDEKLVDLALEGLRLGTHIACTFFMEAERAMFIQALSRFSLLSTPSIPMRKRNLECVCFIIEAALNEGNNLQASWKDVLQCISGIERLLQLATSGLSERNPNEVGASSIELANAFAVAQIVDMDTIERIFQRSSQLSSDAIVYFVENLCSASRDETSSVSEPRMFCLQKMVEVADINMTRIRLVWSRLWSYLSEHFIAVGCHQNRSLAIYAIDSVRQLAMKFLAKDELVNYSFQRDFLKPFEDVIRDAKSPDTREFVVRCISQMLNTRVQNIRSGWRTIFQVLDRAASDSVTVIVDLAFKQTSTVVLSHFAIMADAFVDCVKCLVSFAKNLRSPEEISLQAIDLLGKCMEHMMSGDVPGVPACPPYTSADVVLADAKGEVSVEHQEQQSSLESTIYSDIQSHLHAWFPVLTGLSFLIMDRRNAVRAKAVTILFSNLRVAGEFFSTSLWKIVFSGVVLPLFADLQEDDSDGFRAVRKDTEWIRLTCDMCMKNVVDTYCCFYPRLSPLLHDVTRLIDACISATNQTLVKIGCDAFSSLVTQISATAEPDTWDSLLTMFGKMCTYTSPGAYTWSPLEDATATPPVTSPASSNGNLTTSPPLSKRSSSGNMSFANSAKPDVWEIQCYAQLELARVAQSFVNTPISTVSADQLHRLFDCVNRLFERAHEFNSSADRRRFLIDANCVSVLKLMLTVEAKTAEAFFSIMSGMFSSPDRSEHGNQSRRSDEESRKKKVSEGPLFAACQSVFRNYLDLTSESGSRDTTSSASASNGYVSDNLNSSENSERNMVSDLSQISACVPVVLTVLGVFSHLSDADFKLQVNAFYDSWISLLESPHIEVRKALKNVFQRVRNLFISQ